MQEHLKAAKRRLGSRVRDEGPTFPDPLRYLWQIFLDLHRSRSSNGFGPSPITWADMASYGSIMRIRIDPWEAEALVALDQEYLAHVAEESQNG